PGPQLWRVATGKLLRSIDHPKKNAVRSIAFSPDGKTVASGSWNFILVSDVATGKELARFQAEMQSVNGLAFSPDGKRLSSGSELGSVRIWDVQSKKLLSTLNSRLGVGFAMALSPPDGKTVAMGTLSNTVRLWDVPTRHELFTNLLGHECYIKSIAFTPDGKT